MGKLGAAPRVGAVLGLGLLLLLATVVWVGRTRGQLALASYRAELVARGERLGISEAISPPAPAGDPAEARFVAAASRLQARPQLQTWTRVGACFLAPGELRPLDSAARWVNGGTNVAGWEQWSSALEMMRPQLEELRQALRSPARRSAVDYRVLWAPGPSFAQKRTAALWLEAEALSAAHTPDAGASLASLQALLAVSQLHRDDPQLVNLMIRVAICDLAFATTSLALQSPGWTADRLAALQTAWEDVALLDHVAGVLEGERARVLAWFEQARTNGWKTLRSRAGLAPGGPVNPETLFQDLVLDPVWEVAWAERDQLLLLKTYQGVLDAVRAARQHRSWAQLSPDLAAAVEPVTARTEALDRFRQLLSRMSVPNWSRVMDNTLRAETERSLCVAALAIRRYELERGRAPPDLAALTPDLLARPPVDCRDGQPLRYRLEADGRWRLYSVGLDGRDDGGEPLPAREWHHYESIWDGRDAVWPRIAPPVPVPLIPPSEELPVIRFDDVPLREALVSLARHLGLSVVFDPALEPELRRAVNLRWERTSAAEALRLLLEHHRLAPLPRRLPNRLEITRR